MVANVNKLCKDSVTTEKKTFGAVYGQTYKIKNAILKIRENAICRDIQHFDDIITNEICTLDYTSISSI